MTELARQIAQNVARVREQIAAAAQRSGRLPDSTTLVAVTKYVGLEETRAVLEAGCLDLGESRPQDLWKKAEPFDDPPIPKHARWHLIGNLQRNKVRRTLAPVHLIHSVDSLRLLNEINSQAVAVGRRIPVLLEVNISGEATKHGFKPHEIEPLLGPISGLTHVELRGLMGMAALEGGRDAARENFSRLREWRDRLQAVCPEGVSLAELSMGMSGDFDVAIEEGATIVRVGSALFEGLEPADGPG